MGSCRSAGISNSGVMLDASVPAGDHPEQLAAGRSCPRKDIDLQLRRVATVLVLGSFISFSTTCGRLQLGGHSLTAEAASPASGPALGGLCSTGNPGLLPRPAALDLDLEREAEEGPDQHDRCQHAQIVERGVDRDRADDVGRHQ